MNTFSGVIPVLPTPFLPNGDVDHDSFRAVIEHLGRAEVRAVMFPGFASEFYKLSDPERRQLIREVISVAAAGGMSSIIAVQAHSTRIAIEEARDFVLQGAAAINLLPPQFMSPSAAAIIEHCSAVLAAIPETPVILQYAPTATAPISTEAIVALAFQHPNLVAVKVESRPPYGLIDALSNAESAVPCFAGSGGLFMLDSLRLGAVGVQPGSGFVEIYQAIHDAWFQGRQSEAEGIYLRLLRYLVGWANEQERMVAIEKMIAQRRGLIAHALCRTPHRELTAVEHDSVDSFMHEFSEFF
ncbi:MAG: dihydrodipicolinate synthase family protein [Salinibacterium amurskyense]